MARKSKVNNLAPSPCAADVPMKAWVFKELVGRVCFVCGYIYTIVKASDPMQPTNDWCSVCADSYVHSMKKAWHARLT
jgi:hypothetical protein